jgi:hypothetical protein
VILCGTDATARRDPRAASACRSLLIPRSRREGTARAAAMVRRSAGLGRGIAPTPCISLLISRHEGVYPRTAAAPQHSVVKNNANTMNGTDATAHSRPSDRCKVLKSFGKGPWPSRVQRNIRPERTMGITIEEQSGTEPAGTRRGLEARFPEPVRSGGSRVRPNGHGLPRRPRSRPTESGGRR